MVTASLDKIFLWVERQTSVLDSSSDAADDDNDKNNNNNHQIETWYKYEQTFYYMSPRLR